MTTDELHELDVWLAEHGSIKAYCKAVGYVPPFTTDPNEFATVKREIERRGWSWGSACYALTRHVESRYFFWITDDSDNMKSRLISEARAESEELAGCLALKAALQVSDEDS